MERDGARRVREILAAVRPLAAEYYRLTGKPLGVTGEVAEHVASELLGLDLAPPRTAGHDALRRTTAGLERIQIKGRAYGEVGNPGQRIGTIKRGSACDKVLLVLLDSRTLEPREMWEAPMQAVEQRQNGWPLCVRTGGRLAPEPVADLDRITHSARDICGNQSCAVVHG